jgi:hypothetical protein
MGRDRLSEQRTADERAAHRLDSCRREALITASCGWELGVAVRVAFPDPLIISRDSRYRRNSARLSPAGKNRVEAAEALRRPELPAVVVLLERRRSLGECHPVDL